MKSNFQISSYIETFSLSPLSIFSALEPWALTTNASQYVHELIASLPKDEYLIDGDLALHNSAIIEDAAILKGPLIVGPRCFISAGAYVRGGNWLQGDCILGPGVELKSSFIFSGTKLAHFNFVGDSIVGCNVNLEAGSIIANYRNERENKEILVIDGDSHIKTGVQKFGALVGDNCRIGANAVIAPGAVMLPRTILGRLELLDQDK
jgi:NDP-sugar pyrophosphorylase family protein